MSDQHFVATNDGVTYYLFWDGPHTQGLKYLGGAAAAQQALNGGTRVIQVTPASSWQFLFNDFYVAGTGSFAAKEMTFEEMVAAVTPKDADPGDPFPVTTSDRRVVAAPLAS